VNFGEKEQAWCLTAMKSIRDAGISAEIYPTTAKMKKQMTYANNRNIPFVALVGEDEMNNGLITLKDMEKGEQEKISVEDLILKLK